MPRFPTRPTLAFLGPLLCLAACAPTATVSVSPTATTPPAPTATPTPTLAPAPTPTNVPAGWKVLAGWHFSLAYPPNWSVDTNQASGGRAAYSFTPPPPNAQGEEVQVTADGLPQTVGSDGMAPYCLPPNATGVQHTTFAGLPMAYEIVGEGLRMRTWTFVNAQRTRYGLYAIDATGTAAAQAQDEAILATFRPDNATPWSC